MQRTGAFAPVPSLGLAPLTIEELFAALAALRQEGMPLLVVDQMTGHALALSDRAYLIDGGAVKVTGSAVELARDPALEETYLGPAERVLSEKPQERQASSPA